MKRDWKEAREWCVSLPHDDPEALGIYMHWLYTRHIATKVDVEGEEGNKDYMPGEGPGIRGEAAR